MKAKDINKHKGEFFKILETTENSQTAVMTIKAGEDSGAYGIHPGDQIIYCIEGKGKIEIAGKDHPIKAGEYLTIPAQTKHKGYNTGDKDFFFITIYAPPAY